MTKSIEYEPDQTRSSKSLCDTLADYFDLKYKGPFFGPTINYKLNSGAGPKTNFLVEPLRRYLLAELVANKLHIFNFYTVLIIFSCCNNSDFGSYIF